MPRVMMWNIEMYGINHDGYINAVRIRREFMAATIIRYDVDVVIIQEVRRSCGAELEALRAYLQELYPARAWYFDCIPGALLYNRTQPLNNELGWPEMANYEGYAVLYRMGADGNSPLENLENAPSFGRNRRPDAGADLTQPHLINLVITGLRPQFSYINGTIPINFDWDGAVNLETVLGFPVPTNVPLVVNDFLEPDKNSAVLKPIGVRRPCFVRVSTAGGGAVSLTCYHAPAESRSALYGTLAAFGCRSLVGGVPKGLGGDFNLDIPANLEKVGRQQTAQEYRGTLQLGLDGIYRNQRKTMIHGAPPAYVKNRRWYNNTPEGQYGTSPRDFGLVGGGVEVDPTIPDIVAEALHQLQQAPNAGLYSVIVNELWDESQGWFGDYMAARGYFRETVIDGNTRRNVIEAFFSDLEGGMEIEYPRDSDRTTAVLILMRHFLSDHLPVMFQL